MRRPASVLRFLSEHAFVHLRTRTPRRWLPSSLTFSQMAMQKQSLIEGALHTANLVNKRHNFELQCVILTTARVAGT